MKHREYTVTGVVDSRGRLMIASQDRMTDFFTNWKNAKVVGKFTVYEKGSSEAIKGYYFNKIVPDFRKAKWDSGERHTEAATEAWLRSLSPLLWDETPDINTGEYTARLREINELSNQQMVHYIEHLKQIAAENFDLFIEDPNKI